MPIPDIPKPQTRYAVKSIQGVVMLPVPNRINGTMNKLSIIMVLKTIAILAFLLILCVLKYKLTLLRNVFEKSEFRDLENFGLSIVYFLKM
jgi:hypothetical protein